MKRVIISLALGLALTLTVLVLLPSGGTVAAPGLADGVIFVNQYVTGTVEDGESWGTAYRFLQDALDAAVSGDQIWVAGGVYYPDQGANQVDDAVTSTFVLTNGVALYGGFDPDIGVDTFDERDWMAHPTVLSGDIDHETQPDVTDPYGVVTNTGYVDGNNFHLDGNNAYHVVYGSFVTETATIDGFIITSGMANGPGSFSDGGGMYSNASSPTLKNVTFSGNLAENVGGGLFNTDYSSPTLKNVTFSGNFARICGAGLDNARSSNPILTNAAFFNNFSVVAGGGMCNYRSNPLLTDVNFSHNQVESSPGGGGMYNNQSSPILVGVTFSSNSTGFSFFGSGGGMYNNQSSPILTDVIFSSNSADDSGGGVYNESNSNPILTNVTFFGNSASAGSGGGMASSFSANPSNPVLKNVVFFTNSASLGGGMYNTSNNFVLTNVTFSGNSAEDGAGLYSNSSTFTLTNVIFSANSATKTGGGLYSYYSNAALTNVTFSGNSSANAGGGMHNEYRNTAVLTNTVFWGNTAVVGNQIYNVMNSQPLIRFSDIQDSGGSGDWDAMLGTDGGGNIDDDPYFERNPDPGPDGNWDGEEDDYGDLRLRPDSPAIDSGTNIGCPSTDLDGNLRPINAICDMGAYETGYVLTISKTVDNAFPIPGQTIMFTIVVENQGLDVFGGVISDSLPAGLDFLGPIALQPTGSGLVGSVPPILASGLTISYTDRVTVTFPVTVSYGLEGGMQLINTAAISATEVITPTLASVSIQVVEGQNLHLYLPLIRR